MPCKDKVGLRKELSAHPTGLLVSMLIVALDRLDAAESAAQPLRNKTLAAALADIVWVHAHRNPAWTLESMEREIFTRLDNFSSSKKG